VAPVTAPKPAAVIYVLDGSFLERSIEAADLYRAGFAPRILISRGGPDPSETFFDAQGVHLPTRAEVAKSVLVDRLGLPADAIEPLTTPVGSTAEEARAVAARAVKERWTRVIVITDRASTRRAGYIFSKILGPEIDVIPWASRRDPYNPARWWTTRPLLRTTFYELPKLIVYRLGLGG
jgi:uncharacterized SAM-binding protein YcdF (DUF218 family)